MEDKVIKRLSKDFYALLITKKALEEIKEGINLESWEFQVNEAIGEVDSLIQTNGSKGTGYEKLKNELYFIKYLIAEKK